MADGDHPPERRTGAARLALKGQSTVLAEGRAIGRKIGTGAERLASRDVFCNDVKALEDRPL